MTVFINFRGLLLFLEVHKHRVDCAWSRDRNSGVLILSSYGSKCVEYGVARPLWQQAVVVIEFMWLHITLDKKNSVTLLSSVRRIYIVIIFFSVLVYVNNC